MGLQRVGYDWVSKHLKSTRSHTHTHTHMYIKKVNMTLHSLLIQFSNLKAWRHLNRQIITQWYCKYRVHYRETVLLYEVQTFYKFISISEKKWRGHCSKEEKWHNLRIKGSPLNWINLTLWATHYDHLSFFLILPWIEDTSGIKRSWFLYLPAFGNTGWGYAAGRGISLYRFFFFLGSNIPLALIGLCTGLGYETLDDNSTMRRNRWRENKRVNVTVS